MRRQYLGLGAALVAMAMSAGSAECQAGREREPLALTALIGMEALGLGVEVSPHSHVAIIGRAAGFPGEIADHSVAAGGLRVDPLIDVTAGSLYVTGLIGWARCNRPALDGPTDCVEDDWFGALAGIAGAETRLGGNSSWYAGIEGGYWWGMGRGAASEAVDHLTFAATLRFRPSM